MSKTNVVIGVLAGVAIGALLGILFAPDKGSETRKKLSRKGEDAVDDMKDQFDELIASLTEKFEAAKQEANDLYQKGTHTAEDIKKDVKAHMG